MLAPRLGSSEVRAITMRKGPRRRRPSYHLWPSITQPSPSLHRAGAQVGRVGARARRRLGHAEGRAHLALDDRAQPLFLLRRRADACASTFMLPSSGAMQLSASGPNSERAASSYIAAQRPSAVHAANLLEQLQRQQASARALLRTGLSRFLRESSRASREIHPDRDRAAARPSR